MSESKQTGEINQLSARRWQWRGEHDARRWMVEVHLRGQQLWVASGPANETARRHEEMGGAQPVREFLQDPAPWVRDFPDFHQFLRRVLSSR